MIIVIYFVICKQTRIGNPVDTIPTTGAEKMEDYEEKEDQEGSGPSINYKGKTFGWSGGDGPPQPLRRVDTTLQGCRPTIPPTLI